MSEALATKTFKKFLELNRFYWQKMSTNSTFFTVGCTQKVPTNVRLFNNESVGGRIFNWGGTLNYDQLLHFEFSCIKLCSLLLHSLNYL